MEILILDKQFQTLAVVDEYMSFQWHRVYSGVGDFALYVIPGVYQFIQMGYYVYVADTKELGLVENVELDKDQLIVRGRFYDCIYDRELVYPTASYYNKYPEQIIYDLLHTYFPEIQTPSTLQNLGSKITTQYTGKSVLDVIQDICRTQELGFYTTFTSLDNTLHFSLYQGKNRLPSQSENSFVDFSENFGTLEEYKFTYDVKAEKNYALVAGQESGDDRVTVTVDWRESESEPRKMLWVDARDLQQDADTSDADYKEILRERGREKLLEHVAVENIEVTPIADNLIYQTDYDLGDLCAVDIIHKNEQTGETIFRASLNKRISELTEVWENNCQTLHLTLGEQYQVVGSVIGGGSVSGGMVDNWECNETPSGSINGSNKAFTLTNTPVDINHVIVNFNNLILIPNEQFTLKDKVITITYMTPQSGDYIRVYYKKAGAQ